MKTAALAILMLALGTLIGYYGKPARVETIIKEVKVEDTERIKHEVITESKQLDGTTKRVIVIDSDTKKHTDDKLDSKSITTNTVGIGINLLLPAFTASPLSKAGLHLSRTLIGPITVGAFGFLNGPVGVTIGLSL